MKIFEIGRYEFDVIDQRKTEEGLDSLVIQPRKRQVDCNKCFSTVSINKNGNTSRIVHDFYNNKHIMLTILGNRYICRNCGKTFSDDYSSVLSKGFTTRYINNITKEALRRSFLSVAKINKIGATTVKEFFLEEVKRQDKARVWDTPKCLGVYQVSLNKTDTPIITDFYRNEILEILPDNQTEYINNFLNKMRNKKSTHIVLMSMHDSQRVAVKEILPRAHIVVDKYYAEKAVDYALRVLMQDIKDSVTETEWRKINHVCRLMFEKDLLNSEYDSIQAVFRRYPVLKPVYDLKVRFGTIYNMSSIEANNALTSWIAMAKENVHTVQLADLIQDWKNEILAYWLYDSCLFEKMHIQSIYEIIKLMVKNGSNYSNAIIRGKILYGTRATNYPQYAKVNSKAANHPQFKKGSTYSFTLPGESHTTQKMIRGFGVNIEKLLGYLRSNSF